MNCRVSAPRVGAAPRGGGAGSSLDRQRGLLRRYTTYRNAYRHGTARRHALGHYYVDLVETGVTCQAKDAVAVWPPKVTVTGWMVVAPALGGSPLAG